MIAGIDTLPCPCRSALPPTVPFGGLPLCPLTRDELIEALIAGACAGEATTAHYLNAHLFNLARADRALGNLLSGSDILYADGMSVVWAARLLGHCMPERLSAADYFVEFCSRCAAEGLSLYLLGGAAGVAEAAAARLTQRVEGLRIAGTHHGFCSPAESHRAVAAINASEADVLIVGMGSPRQQRWLAEHSEALSVPVRWGVGALLDYFAGQERRAPQWLCRVGGEWLFRLAKRPRARWRRYLVGNPRFVAWVAREWLGRGGRS